MVYQLRRAVAHEALRQGAEALPVVDPPFVRVYVDPLLVWGPDLPTAVPLDSARREIALAVHNAGGAACRLDDVRVDVAWLTAVWEPGEIAPDGRAMSIQLRLQPGGLIAGEPATARPGQHITTITVTAGSQRLVRTLSLDVADAPIAWFDDAVVRFSGIWPERQVKLSAAKPGGLSYRGHQVAAFNSGSVALYPAEYRLEGHGGMDQAWVEVEGLPPVALPVPGRWFLPGPSGTTVLRNVGTRPLDGRLVPGSPWLAVTPETVALQPGEAVTLSVECRDDGSHFDECQGDIALRSQFGDTILAHLKVERDFAIPGPRPHLIETGGTAAAAATISNIGDAPLTIRPPGADHAITVAPGTSTALPITLGPPHTRTARHLRSALAAETNAALPAWRYFAIPFLVDVVSAELITTAIDFGDLRYQKQLTIRIKVKHSDNARSRLSLAIPPEYSGALRLTGDLLTLHNKQPRPIWIDTDLEVRDDALGGFVLGMVHITGRCLVPKLEVSMAAALSLIPGEQTTLPITITDAGGGLDLRTVTSDQPWIRIERKGDKLRARVVTTIRDRGVIMAAISFISNDFVNPEQIHTLSVQLRPTFRMRVQDVLDWCLDNTWGRLLRVFRPKSYRR
jgi:hypothetical protein